MKKVISLVLVFITIFIVVSVPIRADDIVECYRNKYEPDESEHLINGIYYMIDTYGDGEKYAIATYSVRKGSILKYPDYIKYKNKKYKVKEVTDTSFSACDIIAHYQFPYKEVYLPKYAKEASFSQLILKNLRKLHIPENVMMVYGLSDYDKYSRPKLKIVIDKKNKYIKMKNGAIYSKNGKELRTLVNAKKTYKISKGTKKVNITRNNKVEKLVFPNDLKRVNEYSDVGYCKNLKTIKFGKNTERVSVDIYECNSLKKIDFGKKLKVFDGDIHYNNALECVEFPKTLEKIGNNYVGGRISGEKLSKIILNNEKHAPKIKSYVFSSSNDGLGFYVKNQTVADELLNEFQTKQTDVKNANIYVGDTLVYSNINYSKTN